MFEYVAHTSNTTEGSFLKKHVKAALLRAMLLWTIATCVSNVDIFSESSDRQVQVLDAPEPVSLWTNCL